MQAAQLTVDVENARNLYGRIEFHEPSIGQHLSGGGYLNVLRV